jgi:integrase
VNPTGPLPACPFTPTFRIYDLRYTFATLALANSVSVNVVAVIMGHEKASFTFARYGHALKNDTQGGAAKMEAVLFGNG